MMIRILRRLVIWGTLQIQVSTGSDPTYGFRLAEWRAIPPLDKHEHRRGWKKRPSGRHYCFRPAPDLENPIASLDTSAQSLMCFQ